MAQFTTVCESLPFSQREVQVREIGPRSEEAVEPPCFAITGHHRSGTSLVASLLQSAGLDIGERLMAANEYNKRGYFEDLDFHEFQVAVLRAQGFHDAGYILQPSVSVPAQIAFGLGDLLQKRKRTGRPWGWKEPRSTLFLDFWHEQLPQLNFLLLFRAPWEVVDSLFRRGDENFLKNPSMAVRVWLNYNRALLDFYDRHPERCLLLESYVVARGPSRLIEAIARKFGHHFGPIEDLYDKELYTHHESPQYQALLACCFPEAIEVYHELRSKAEITSSAEFPSHSCDTPVSATADWALQPWIDCRIAEKELKHCRTELAQKEAALKQWDTVSEQALAAQQQLLTERDNLRTQTRQLREQLDLSQQQHQAAQAQIQELESCRLKLQDTVAEQALAAQQQLLTERDNLRTQTHQLREQLDLSQQQHQAAQLRIQDMENSRFWKLRGWWKRLRHPFRGS
jgi:hypothetical protein